MCLGQFVTAVQTCLATWLNPQWRFWRILTRSQCQKSHQKTSGLLMPKQYCAKMELQKTEIAKSSTLPSGAQRDKFTRLCVCGRRPALCCSGNHTCNYSLLSVFLGPRRHTHWGVNHPRSQIVPLFQFRSVKLIRTNLKPHESEFW